MMDGAIKNLVHVVNQFSKSPTEDLLKNLLNRIDAVITKTANGCPAVSSTELMLSECLLGVVNLLNAPKTPPKVVSKVLLLIANFAASDGIQHALKHSYNLPATLALVVRVYSTKPESEQIILQCLQLLQAVTYNYAISYPSTHMEQLVNFLINNISQPEGELTLPSLGVLANLCRANVGVQMQIRAMPNLKAINKTLMRYLSSSDCMVIVCSLSTLTSLCFNDDLGEKLFQGQNINQTFRLLFNLLLYKEEGLIRQYTADLLVDLMRYPRIQQDFMRFPHIDNSLRLSLGLLYKLESKDLCKIVEFLLAALKVGELRNKLAKMFLETGNDGATHLRRLISFSREPVETGGGLPVLVLRLLEDVYQELIVSGSLPAADHDNLVQSLTANLTTPVTPSEDSVPHCQRVTSTLGVITCICGDGDLRGRIAAALDPQGIYSLIEHQLDDNEIVSIQLKTAAKSECCDASAEMVLCLLGLVVCLKPDVPVFEEMAYRIFKDSRVIPFLVYGITSESQGLIQRSLHLFNCGVSYPEFPKGVLEEKLSSINQDRMRADSRQDVVRREVEAPRNDSKNGSRSMNDTDEKIDTLIDMMQSELDLNGLQAGEIMDVYEHKLASLQTKQSHLEDLLETKAMALEQADRLIAQHRCQSAQANAEAGKLRSFLREAERCKKNYKEELHEAAGKYSELTRRLEDTETHLASVENELESQKERNEMLKRHLQTMKEQYEEATTKFEESLERKEKKLRELEGLMTKETERTKHLTRENEDREKRITQLQTDLEKLEGIRREKVQQLETLEDLSRKQAMDIQAKDEIIEGQKKELSKVQEMRRMIHMMTKT